MTKTQIFDISFAAPYQKSVHSDLTEGKFVEAFEHLFEIVNLTKSGSKSKFSRKTLSKSQVDKPVKLTLLDHGSAIETKSIESKQCSIRKDSMFGPGLRSLINM